MNQAVHGTGWWVWILTAPCSQLFLRRVYTEFCDYDQHSNDFTCRNGGNISSCSSVWIWAHLNEDWVSRSSIFGATVLFWWFQAAGSVGAWWFMDLQRRVGVYRTLDEVPLHFLIYVCFAASKSWVNSHAEWRSIEHGARGKRSCQTSCSHDPHCLASFAAKNGCYRAKRPASKSCTVDFDAQHANDRHWLPRESMKGGMVPEIRQNFCMIHDAW